ncbi:hypothetical protein Tco_0794503 [Tanacetum coccineum]
MYEQWAVIGRDSDIESQSLKYFKFRRQKVQLAAKGYQPLAKKCHWCLTVAAEYFFNNDLEFLKSSDPKKKYTTSITKTKAARYEIVGIEDMVPTLWSAIKVGYDKDALKGIKHWGDKRQLWYRSKHKVHST